MAIIESLAIAVGVNLLMFVPAYILRTDKLTDISYGLSFILVAGIILFSNTVTFGKLILFAMITIWGIRIGGYLLIRIQKIGRDKRFDGMRESFVRFGGFWLLQGFTVFVVLLASTQYFLLEITPLTYVSAIGILVWAIGLTIETVSDLQKYEFINNEANKGKWIDTGLWKFSRHPNYFGEILLWLGVFIYTFPAIGGAMYAIGFISPLFIALLIIKVSGIPKLEAAADTRWGTNDEYKAYKRNTNSLILGPPKR